MGIDGGIHPTLLQGSNDSVANVHLIVKIFTLQFEQLPVEVCHQTSTHLRNQVGVDERTVKRADYIKPQLRGTMWKKRNLHAIITVIDNMSLRRYAFYHLI